MIDQKITAVATFAQASSVPIQIALTAAIMLVLTFIAIKVMAEMSWLTENAKEWIGASLFINGLVLVVSLLWMVWTRL